MWTRKNFTFFGISLVVLILFIVNPLTRESSRCTRCKMSIMSPIYADLTGQISSKYSFKYRFFRYYDSNIRARHQNCVPLLFVPGSVGSYRQVRSLGSELFKLQSLESCFDIYSVDFRQEFVAFTPSLLYEQVVYVSDVIKKLKEKYSEKKSIALIGHSFGGVVLKMLPLLDVSMINDGIALLVYISSPLDRAPLTTSSEFANLYLGMDKFWRNFESERITELVIESGDNDILVPSTLSGNQLGFRIPVDAIAGSWSDPHHQGMIWENGLMKSISTLFKNCIGREGELQNKTAILDLAKAITSKVGNPVVYKSAPSIKCANIVKVENSMLIKPYTVSDSNGVHCFVIKVNGNFEVITNINKSHFNVYFATKYDEYRKGSLRLDFAGNVDLDVLDYVGKSFPLSTTTGTGTIFFENWRILRGNFSGYLFFYTNVKSNMEILGSSKEEWKSFIEDGQVQYERFLGDRVFTVRSNACQQRQLSDISKFSFIGNCVQISVDSLLPRTILINSKNIVGVRVTDDKGRYRFAKDLTDGFKVHLRTGDRFVEILFLGNNTHNVKIMTDYFQTVRKIIVGDFDRSFMVIHLLTINILFNFSNFLLSFSPITIVGYSSTLSFDSINLKFIFNLCILSIMLLRFRMRWGGLKKFKGRILISSLLLISPISGPLKRCLLTATSFRQNHIRDFLALTFAITPSILTVLANFRNFLILRSDIGLSLAILDLTHNFTIRYELEDLLLFAIVLIHYTICERPKRKTLLMTESIYRTILWDLMGIINLLCDQSLPVILLKNVLIHCLIINN